MKQQKRHIDRWGFSRKWQIWENGELGKNPSKFGKTSIEVTKRRILTNGDNNKKMANLGEKVRQKWWILQKLIKCLAKTHKWVDKKKACEIWVPVEIEPRVVPDLIVSYLH